MSTDFFPTLLDLAGLSAAPDLHADGVSLLPLLSGKSVGHRTLFWHYPHYHGSTWKPGAAIRDGDWKLIEFFEDHHAELYNLRDDIGENKNQAQANPKKAKEMRNMLKAWQKQVNAKFPTPNHRQN